MSSVFATHPPSLLDLGPRPDLPASCLPVPPCSRRSQHTNSFDTSLTFTGGLPTPPKAMNADYVAVAQHLQPTHIPTSRYQHAPASAVGVRPSLSQSSYKSSSYTSPDAHQPFKFKPSAAAGPLVEKEKAVIAAHLQIPDSVNKSKGSLAEFAAEITCLFWFESSETLDLAEKTAKDGRVGRGLVADSSPTPGFRKWVTTILSTTQVSKEVILLALMFIYRLKKYNPTVSGKRGSEFRLLTIALMLGNKFLDDNTYTNKTWAEVSGISVTEIHIMEVEFLSNMRYELYASESDWYEWKEKLGRLGAFYEKAAALPPTDVQPITPTTQAFTHKLPSPRSTHGGSSNRSSNRNSGNNNTNTNIPLSGTSYAAIPHPASTAPQLPRSPLRQRQSGSSSDLGSRKRSFDSAAESHPAKRMHYSGYEIPAAQSNGLPTPQPYLTPGSLALPTPFYASNADQLRLPVPRLAPPQMAENQLAPLNVPVSRAMSSVYTTTPSSSAAAAAAAAVAAASSQPITPLSAASSAAAMYQAPMTNLGLYQASHPHANGLPSHNSPTSAYGTGISTPTLPGLSPSHFLGDRQSPYRPVRNVNTLLIPPPSAALQNSVRNIAAEQIRYQPLGKANNEYRSGPLPHLHTDNWQQSNTPLAQKYPYRF